MLTQRFTILILLTLGGPLLADPTGQTLVKALVLESNVAYLRVGQVTPGLAEEIQAALQTLAATNKPAGTVLDLRFADGGDLDAAKKVADVFEAKKNPLAILVNAETRGAALALATGLRKARTGLVFGNPATELKPDIEVQVKIGDEEHFLAFPFDSSAQNETNSINATNGFQPFIDHTSEADLVRNKIKDGQQIEESLPPYPTDPPKPYIHDPVLARAVDLIKALAVVRQTHS